MKNGPRSLLQAPEVNRVGLSIVDWSLTKAPGLVVWGYEVEGRVVRGLMETHGQDCICLEHNISR